MGRPAKPETGNSRTKIDVGAGIEPRHRVALYELMLGGGKARREAELMITEKID
jgi:hypothetical protein